MTTTASKRKTTATTQTFSSGARVICVHIFLKFDKISMACPHTASFVEIARLCWQPECVSFLFTHCFMLQSGNIPETGTVRQVRPGARRMENETGMPFTAEGFECCSISA